VVHHRGQALLGAEDRRLVGHVLLELFTYACDVLAGARGLQPFDAIADVDLDVVGQVGVAHGVDVRRHRLTAAATEHDDVEQGVGAETVGAVHGDARALAGGVEAGEHRVGGVDHDLGVDVGGDPAHGVVGGGLDGNGVGLRLEALVGADEVGDVGDLGVDVLGREVGEVEVDVVLVGSRAAALPD